MDDPDWEVLPTKKKYKYIVKLRTTPISLDYRENSESENYAMVKYAGSLSPSSRKKACYIGFGVCSSAGLSDGDISIIIKQLLEWKGFLDQKKKKKMARFT